MTHDSTSNDTEVTDQFITAVQVAIQFYNLCTNYKIHVFTGPGTFDSFCSRWSQTLIQLSIVVTRSWCRLEEVDLVEIMDSGGGGAGGFREVKNALQHLDAGLHQSFSMVTQLLQIELAVTAQGYPITVGGGGAGKQQVLTSANGSMWKQR